jgi:hypothetical protein
VRSQPLDYTLEYTESATKEISHPCQQACNMSSRVRGSPLQNTVSWGILSLKQSTYLVVDSGIHVICEYARDDKPSGDRDDTIQLERHSGSNTCEKGYNRVYGRCEILDFKASMERMVEGRAPLAPYEPLSRPLTRFAHPTLAMLAKRPPKSEWVSTAELKEMGVFITSHVEEQKLAAAYHGEDGPGHKEEREAIKKDVANIFV